MLLDASQGKFDVVMAWALDRVGRSLSDLLATIKRLEACKADLFIDKELIDTTSPTGMMPFHITGAFAQFERTLIVSRVNAGVDRARAAGTKLGRPRIDAKKEEAIRTALVRGDKGKHKLAAEFGVGSGTVARIRAELTSAL